MAEKAPKTRRLNKRNGIISIIIAVILIGGVASLAVFFPTIIKSRDVSYSTVRIPLIVSQLTSKTDGQEYNVQSIFSVQIERESRRNVSMPTLQEMLRQIMTEIDLDELTKPDGVYYLNEQATRMLNERLADQVESMVFVTGLYIGDRVKLSDDYQQRDDVMKGLFDKLD